MITADRRPTRREWLEALLLALLCSLAFLREGVLPSRSVVPFVPERYQPLRAEIEASGVELPADIDAGNASMGDKYNQSLAWDRIQQDRLRSGSIPLWTDDIAGGAPFVPQMAQVYQPWNALLLANVPSHGMYGIWFLLHQVLFGLFAWRFVRSLGAGQLGALVTLCCVTIGLWTQARIHHNVIVSAALPLFPLLMLVQNAFRDRFGPMHIAATGLMVGVTWSGGFAPVSLQTCYLTGIWALWHAARSRRFRPLLPIAIGFGLGAVLALAQMVPTLLAAQRSAREAATPLLLASKGLELANLWTLLWPDLLNWPSNTQQVPPWAALEALPPAKAAAFNWPETAFALGLPALLCLPLAFTRRFLSTAVVFGLVAIAAFGLATARTPFLELSGILPGARAGDMRRFLFLVAMTLSVLAGLGADSLDRSRWTGRFVGIGALTIGICSAVAWLQWRGMDADAFRMEWAQRVSDAHPEFPTEAVDAAMQARAFETPTNQAAHVFMHGRTAIVALALGILLWLRRGRLRTIGILSCIVLDLASVGAGTIVPVERERVARLPNTLTPVASAERETDTANKPARLFRFLIAPPANQQPIVNLFPPNLGAFHGLEDLGAYNPLPARRMEELFSAIEPGTPVATRGAGVVGFFRAESLHSPIADLLGMRFVLSERSDLELGDGLRDVTPPGTPAPYRLVERTTTWPRATFVDRAVVRTDPELRLKQLTSPDHDARNVVVLEQAGLELQGDGEARGRAVVEYREPGRVRIRVTAEETGYVRLADPFDPGWQATIDGKPAPLLAADHYLRAVRVEPGDHLIEMTFDAPQVRAPWMVSSVGLLAVVVLTLAGLWRRRREPRATLPE